MFSSELHHLNQLFPSLANHFLVAMPGLLDQNFAGTVIFVCEHTANGALGLVINRHTEILVSSLFERLELRMETDSEIFPWKTQRILYGGPVQVDRGFVLHTAGRIWNSTMQVAQGLSLTTSKDVLEALSQGHGPQDWLITLGYAGWSAGQLEAEIAKNAWLTAPGHVDVLFHTPIEQRLAAIYKILGFDPARLSGFAGRA
jgi:putative transcriptional regulator